MVSARDIRPAIAGFEGIQRSWDPTLAMPCARILPGEFYVTRHDEAISTVLGSCISACIRYPDLEIGGMNHFMLPASARSESMVAEEARYGSFAMERLINELIKLGARREHLEVKIVGGGRIYQERGDVGQSNIDFVYDYLATERLKIIAKDVGGTSPRRVQYFPQTGRLRVKKLAAVQMASVEREEKAHIDRVSSGGRAGSVELF